MGAGAIGGFVGVRAAAAGVPVTMIGRSALSAVQDRLKAVDLDNQASVPTAELRVSDDPADLADADVCLLTTKSKDTIEAGTRLKEVLPPEVPVVSLQNGLDNPERLRSVGLSQVVPGLVTFNVVWQDAVFRQTTSGPIVTEAGDSHPGLAELVGRLTDVPWIVEDDLRAMQAGKLLINLNNGVCAASGVTVAESLKSKALRRVFALCIREGLKVFARAGHPVRRIGRISPEAIARILVLPDFLFTRLAQRMVKVDPLAKSSTLQDLERGRPTEIDDLNGAIVRLGEQHGVQTPANRYITETIKRLEETNDRVHPSVDDIVAAVG